MRTYWQATVRNSESHSCVMVGDENLSETIAKAITESIYMQAVNPTAKISITDIAQYCSVCYNNGTTQNKKYKYVRCPECKGKVPTATVDPIDFTMPDPANRISLVAA